MKGLKTLGLSDKPANCIFNCCIRQAEPANAAVQMALCFLTAKNQGNDNAGATSRRYSGDLCDEPRRSTGLTVPRLVAPKIPSVPKHWA